MEQESKIAIAALVVALVALLTTISQVLGQLFATADGYRRCQASIIGGWGRLTHRKFRWSELRFETIYTTPRFALMPYTGKTVNHEMGRMMSQMGGSTFEPQEYKPLDGSPEMIQKTYATPLHQPSGLGVFNQFNEMASWVRFIDALHSNAAETRMLIRSAKRGDTNPGEDWNGYTIPMITSQRHSWDFVPPEVIRPLAVATLQDIAIFSRRLGMRWKTFEPSEGILRAEGNHHTVDSTTVRSVGVVVQFSIRNTLSYPRSFEELYIPTEQADKMGFGILPGDDKLHIPDHVIRTPADCLARTLEIDVEAGDTLGELINDSGWTPGFSDIIGLAAPMIRLPGSQIIKIPRPAVYEGGLTLQQEGIVVFHNRLRDFINERNGKGEPVNNQTHWVLQQLEELSARYGETWIDEKRCQGNTTPVDFLDDLHKRHDMTTEYFDSLQYPAEDKVPFQGIFHYTDLMYSHITHAVNYPKVAWKTLDAGEGRDHYGQKVQAWITEGAHVYFDMLPKIIKTMKQRGFDDAPIVEEAWFTMMLRAFLWHRTHLMVEGNMVPSQHWGSRLPVYIG
ncbi:MAG: hypothetical protein Q9169_003520 [Polycauliona sp. 2 TL-2023]